MQSNQHRLRRSVVSTLFLPTGIFAIVLLANDAQAKETMLYSFQGAPDGSQPWSALIADQHGNLFGTTNLGGTGSCNGGCGTQVELSPQGKSWSESVLYSFRGGTDGAYPNAAVVMDARGNLYGVTEQGGTGDCSDQNFTGCGTVFELTPQKNGDWSESVLHSFQGVPNGRQKSDASWPNALILAPQGQLIGSAYNGGSCPPPYDSCAGAVFELTKHHGTWQEKIIYNSDEATNGPSGVLLDDKGNLYSVASFGGPENLGEIFMLTPPSGKGEWAATDLYDFQNQNDGALPVAGLALDAAGDLFGASSGTDSVAGNVFELTPAGNGSWTESVVISFASVGNGYYPSQGPIPDSKGNLFGETEIGGKTDNGIVYEASPKNGGWTEKVLHGFSGGSDGSEPLGGVLMGKDGTLYGTTAAGGTDSCFNGCGAVFRITP